MLPFRHSKIYYRLKFQCFCNLKVLAFGSECFFDLEVTHRTAQVNISLDFRLFLIQCVIIVS